MNSRGNSRHTSVVISRGLSPKHPDARGVRLSLGIMQQVGYGAAGLVDVIVSPQSITSAPATLVLQRVQFMTAIGHRKCAKWAAALEASASKAHFAAMLC